MLQLARSGIYSNPECRSDENCLNNTCIKKSGCLYDNPSCSLNETCNKNVCVLLNGCKYSNPQCNANEDCVDNVCVKKQGCQYSNPTCSESYLCNQQTGQCEKQSIIISAELKQRWKNYLLAFNDSRNVPVSGSRSAEEHCHYVLGMSDSSCYSTRSCLDAARKGGFYQLIPFIKPPERFFLYYNATQTLTKQVSLMIEKLSSLTSDSFDEDSAVLKTHISIIRNSTKIIEDSVLLPYESEGGTVLPCHPSVFNYKALDALETEINNSLQGKETTCSLTGCTYGSPRCSETDVCDFNLNTCHDRNLPKGCDYSNPPCSNDQVCENNQCKTPVGCQYNNPSCYPDEVCVNNQCVLNNP